MTLPFPTPQGGGSCGLKNVPAGSSARLFGKRKKRRSIAAFFWREYVGIEPTWAALHHLHRF
jgi:hypothetical protein